jgi:hypothetical protein
MGQGVLGLAEAIMTGDQITAPRCLHPMAFYAKPGHAGPDPVCWRPAGHPRPDRHMSKYAYLRDLERSLRRKQENRGAA